VHVRERDIMNNEQSRLGVIACILALMPVLGFVAILCAGHVAQANEVIGISLTMVMYATIVIAPVIGLICGAMSLLRKPPHRALPVAGTLLNAIWMVVVLFLYMAIQIHR
jgi:Na+/phosphate symporter